MIDFSPTSFKTIESQFDSVNDLHKIQQKYIEENKKLDELKLLEESEQINTSKVKKQLAVFTDYVSENFLKKVKLDNYIYESFYQNIEEQEDKDIVLDEMTKLYENLDQIYQLLNVSPQTKHLFKSLTLESSEDDLMERGHAIVENYIVENFSKLSAAEKNRRYAGEVIAETMVEIQNQSTLDTITDHKQILENTYKTTVLKGLIESISIPYMVKCNIDTLLNSEVGSEIFETEELVDRLELFDQQATTIARVFSTLC